MIRYAFITLFTLLCACIAIYAIWTVKVSRNRPDELVTAFKKIDRSLIRTSDSLQNTGVGAFKKFSHSAESELTIKANAIKACIDSIRHEVVDLAGKKATGPFSYPDKSRLLVLKKDLIHYNLFIQEKFPGNANIRPVDFIAVENRETGDQSIPWEVYHFENTNALAAILELKYVVMQVEKLKQKAMQ